MDDLLLLGHLVGSGLNIDAFAGSGRSRRVIDHDGDPMGGFDVLGMTHLRGGNPKELVLLIKGCIDRGIPGQAIRANGRQRDIEHLRENRFGALFISIHRNPPVFRFLADLRIRQVEGTWHPQGVPLHFFPLAFPS